MNTIGKNLSALILSKNTTQSAIAAIAGVTEGAVSSWLNGRNRPREKYLLPICDYYQVSMDDLTSESNGIYAKVHGLAKTQIESVSVSVAKSSFVPIRVLNAQNTEDNEQWKTCGEVMLYDDKLRRHPNAFALEVNGSCMDKLFTDSDHIFVDPDMKPSDGSIAVFLLNNEAIVRRMKRGCDSALLVAESWTHHSDIIVRDKESALKCIGVVFWWQAKQETK